MIATEFASAQDSCCSASIRAAARTARATRCWRWRRRGYAPDAITDTIAVHTAAMQRQAGNWHVGDVSRAPIQESEIARTARGMRTLQLYGPPGAAGRNSTRASRAPATSSWKRTPRRTTISRCSWSAAHWAGAPRTKVQALGRGARRDAARGRRMGTERESRQRRLCDRRVAVGAARERHPQAGATRRTGAACKFLLATQWPDGSWYVRSRAPKFQPYFESGFPFDHDQWVSSAATAWAVMALAPAIEKEKK